MVTTDLEGDVALVTGASSGIGRATARELGSLGASVAVAARREDRLREVAETIDAESGVETLVLQTDVTDDAQVETMVSETVNALGGLDIVVSNAGVNALTPVDEMSTEEYRSIMSVNVDGTFFTTREALPHLQESGGHIVYMGSFAGQYPRPHQPIYASTKWWLRGFALSLAGDVGSDDIAVTVINPTEVLTEIDTAQDSPGKEVFDQERSATPAEIAENVAFAVLRDTPNTINELDLYSRDKFKEFAPPRSED